MTGFLYLCFMSRKVFALSAGIAFLMCLIAMFFGASIFNANENVLVEHLNDMDKLNYFDDEQVPALSRLAAIITIPLILIIAGIEVYIFIKSSKKKVKTIALVLLAINALLLILALILINNHHTMDFSHWGFAWIVAGFFTIVGNVGSIFLKK